METDHEREPSPRIIVTEDHEVIRRWAATHQAEPATGEETASGAATSLKVNDGGAGIRFNFPSAAPFRPISWAEWFEHFDRHRLKFMYREELADRAYEVWETRGRGHGHDRADWFEAERELGDSATGGAHYRFTKGT